MRAVGSVSAIPTAWDTLDHGPSPFLLRGFLSALEDSGSIDRTDTKSKRRSGWAGVYLLVEREDGTLVGAVPAFLKDHSYGEYIFDWGWASASQRAGIPYYPKLVVGAPHTPATGARLLLARDLDPAMRAAVRETLAAAVRQIAEDADCSSIHWLFCTAEEQAALAALGFAARATHQFHWKNRGYASFDDFLATLKSRKRKQLKKERAKAQGAIDRLTWHAGGTLDEVELADVDRFYRNTTDNHGGRDYLRPGFFHAVAKSLPDIMQMAFVTQGGKRVAGALFFETDQALYGRYWGTDVAVDCLHFETAYYAGIDRTIARGLPLFEAGAQGEHKLVRGFEPCMTYSSHWLRHPGLARAIAEHLAAERVAVEREIEHLATFGPYRGTDDE